MRYAQFGGEHRIEKRGPLLRRAARMGRFLLWPALGSFGLSVLSTAARVLGPFAVRGGIDEGVAAGDKSAVVVASVVFLVLLVVQYYSQRWAHYAVAVVGERFLRRLRRTVFAHILRLDMAFFDRTKTGVLVSRMTADIEALNTFVSEGAVLAMTNLLTVAAVTVAMLVVDVRLTLATLVVIAVLILLTRLFQRRVAAAYAKIRERIGRVLASLQEGITGVRVVQAFTQESRQFDDFSRVNERFFEANMEAARQISWYFPSVALLRVVAIAAVVGLGGARVLDGSLSTGSLFAFVLLLDWFFAPIVNLANVYNLLQAALAALDKLFTLLDERPDVAERPGAYDVPDPVRGDVALAGVRFAYAGGPEVLHGVDVCADAGERVAIVGETGSGKSTIAKLVMRLYDPTSGAVTVDGVDLRDVTFASRARTIVLIPQDDFLFDGSLRDNLRYGKPDADDREITDVLRAMDLVAWVGELPQGLDTPVRERGSRFSAGERQLIALARAFLVDPAVIVLDEATSSLDPETELRVEGALRVLLSGRTAIVIAHRLRSAMRSDRVVMVDAGEIIAEGTHDELATTSEDYAHLIEVWSRGNA